MPATTHGSLAHPPLLLPRGLILLASAWLIASWVLSIGIRAPIEPSSASYTPGVRVMLMCVAAGLVVGWPLLRLSQPCSHPIKMTLLDLVVLVALLQVVLWPLRLVTPWSPARTTAIDLTLTLWTCLVGAVVATACGARAAGPRLLAIGVCLSMSLAGPLVAWILSGWSTSPPPDWLPVLGPLLEVRVLTGGGGTSPSDLQWNWTWFLAGANLLAWIGLSVAERRGRPSAVPSR